MPPSYQHPYQNVWIFFERAVFGRPPGNIAITKVKSPGSGCQEAHYDAWTPLANELADEAACSAVTTRGCINRM